MIVTCLIFSTEAINHFIINDVEVDRIMKNDAIMRKGIGTKINSSFEIND